MKRFLISLSIFVAVILLSLAVIELIVRKIPNAYKYKSEQLNMQKDSLQVVVLGASNAYMGIDPQYFSLIGFNAANVSQTLKYDNYLLEKFVLPMPNIKYVILTVSPTMLFHSFSKPNSEEWFREIYYSLYMGNNEYGLLSKKRYEICNPTVAADKLFGYYLFKEDFSRVTKSGFSEMYFSVNKAKDWNKVKNVGEIVNPINKNDRVVLIDNCNYLANIAKQTASHKIKLILVSTPVLPVFTSHCDADKIKKFDALIKSTLEGNSNILYYDFSKDSSFKDEDFFDVNHLSEYGSKKLTLKIDSLLCAQTLL